MPTLTDQNFETAASGLSDREFGLTPPPTRPRELSDADFGVAPASIKPKELSDAEFHGGQSRELSDLEFHASRESPVETLHVAPGEQPLEILDPARPLGKVLSYAGRAALAGVSDLG